MKIYFAHSFRLRNTQTEKELIEFLKQFGEVINPFDREDELEAKFKAPYYALDPPSIEYSREIALNDLNLVSQSDIVVAYVSHAQVGTWFEVCHAIFNCGKKVYVISPQHSPFYFLDGITWIKNIENLKEVINEC